ncbi:MAG TPA: FUSC family protein [Jatrophihabitantaceae bacterium]
MTARVAQLGSLLRDAARLDRTQSDPVVSFRNAVGVVVPLAIATLAGSAAAGLPSTVGALQTGFADRPGPYRLRLIRMIGCALAAATTSAVAVVLSDNNIASAALVLVLAFGAGLLLTAGPAATQVGVASVAAALIIGHVAQSPSHALVVGLLVLAGGAGQTVLAVAAWPLGRHRPERGALATLYRALAEVARDPKGTSAGPQASAPVDAARQTLYGLGHDFGPSVEAYQVLLDEAERIRREAMVLAGLGERLSADGDTIAAGLVRAALASVGDVLDDVAGALDAGQPVDPATLPPARSQVRRAVTRLEEPGPSRGELTRRATAARLRALAGQLRAVVETSVAGASEGRRPEVRDLTGGMRVRDPIAILRANLSPNSAVLRHAARTALLVAGSDLVVRLAGYGRGYWVPLTILVVLRPDFASTFQRATMRVVGTVLGLLIATELLHWVPGGDWFDLALIALFYFGVRLAGPGNLALTAVSLSGLVVVLLAINGVPTRETLVDRSVATLVGGALALFATLLFPVWERELVPDRLADLLAAYRGYLVALADPHSSREDRDRARSACRLARTNAEASVQRARAEPVAARRAVQLGETVLANSHRVVHALMTIDSVRTAERALPTLEVLLREAAEALDACAQAVRTGTVPRGFTPLRPTQERLHRVLRDDPARAGGIETAGALADASDRLANAVDTLASELRRRFATREARTAPSTVR